MAPLDIHKKLTPVPFQPIRLHLTDGASIDVTANGQAAVTLTEVTIAVDPDESGLSTRSIYVAPGHVTRVEPIQPVTPPEENQGKSRKK